MHQDTARLQKTFYVFTYILGSVMLVSLNLGQYALAQGRVLFFPKKDPINPIWFADSHLF